MLGHHLVEFCDQFLHRGHKLDDAFGHEHSAVVHAHVVTLHHDVGNLLGNVMQGHVASLYLLTDDAVVGAGLQGALECDVRCRASHQFHEVPVLLGRVAVTCHITDQLAVDLGSRVKAE